MIGGAEVPLLPGQMPPKEFQRHVDEFNHEGVDRWQGVEAGSISIHVLCKIGEEGIDYKRGNFLLDLTAGKSQKYPGLPSNAPATSVQYGAFQGHDSMECRKS